MAVQSKARSMFSSQIVLGSSMAMLQNAFRGAVAPNPGLPTIKVSTNLVQWPALTSVTNASALSRLPTSRLWARPRACYRASVEAGCQVADFHGAANRSSTVSGGTFPGTRRDCDRAGFTPFQVQAVPRLWPVCRLVWAPEFTPAAESFLPGARGTF
jgi:hypothetical protein